MSSSLELGKLGPEILRKLVFNRLGTPSSRVLLGPSIGEDASVIDFGQKALVIHSDPITGAIENVGWLAVNVCANDIATRGVRPLWILIVMLLPKDIMTVQLERITNQVDDAAKKLGIMVVGGHCEVSLGINRPILVSTTIGEAEKEKLVSTGGAKTGDQIIMTKGAAIEGTAILSTEFEEFLQKKVGGSVVRKAQSFISKISVVKDALTAVAVGGVHAMHDATEGGIAGALQEIAWASKVGIKAFEEPILVYKETRRICKVLNIDPLKTISSGALIVSAHPEKAEEIVAALKKEGVEASIIGQVVDAEKASYLQRNDGSKINLSEPISEELWKALDSFEKKP